MNCLTGAGSVVLARGDAIDPLPYVRVRKSRKFMGLQDDLAVVACGRALESAGLDRHKVYVTNVVKHFKNEPRGKRRLHKRPNRYEVEVCKVWLDQEIALVRPQLVLAMGVTAASALAGKAVTLSRERGKEMVFPGGQHGMVTIHPSSILRAPDDAGRRAAYAGLVKDLKLALKAAAKLPQAA